MLETASISSLVQPVRLEVKRLAEKAICPSRVRDSDACFDIYSLHDCLLQARSSLDISTGIVVTAPCGWYLTIEGRSSLFRHGLFPNRGIIDAGYTGELIVILNNFSNVDYQIKSGDRVAQMALQRCQPVVFAEVAEISKDYTLRGENGFGSSGR